MMMPIVLELDQIERFISRGEREKNRSLIQKLNELKVILIKMRIASGHHKKSRVK